MNQATALLNHSGDSAVPLEVNVIPFKFKHLELLHEMLKSQNYARICDIEMRTLPKIGYIALLNNQPIAAGFLRRLEPSFAQIDTLVSNAHFGSIIRHQGIQLVVSSLIQDAKALQLEGILATTSDTGVLSRAKELGFVEVDQKLIALKL
jgi:hypothetical protein